MPELPEVETTLRGIRPHLEGRRIARLVLRESRFRQPIPPETPARLAGQGIRSLERRAKYILIELDRGCLLLHLGMSGSLRIVVPESPPRKHDHLDLVLTDRGCLRFHDPRRFGLFLWTEDPPDTVQRTHPLLRGLGPEPLSPAFDGDHLHRLAQSRRLAVKSFIMDAGVVVGVGNIYASEALFLAGLHPARACNDIGLDDYRRLADRIRGLLADAIAQGGTTLRDFVGELGQSGYFNRSLRVYGREGQPCRACGNPLRQQRIGQRSSFYCASCQPRPSSDS